MGPTRWLSVVSSRSSLSSVTRSKIAKVCLALRSWMAMAWSCWARSSLAKGRKKAIRVERKSERKRDRATVVCLVFFQGLKGFVCTGYFYKASSGGGAYLQRLFLCSSLEISWVQLSISVVL